MHEVAAFLRGHPPFDLATDEQLEDVAAAVEIEFHAAGEVLLAAGAARDYAQVVRRGALELLDGERVLDVLGEGELAGHRSMLSGEPAGLTVRAAEDTLTYRVPAAQLAPLVALPGGLRWVARSLGRRAALLDQERPLFEPTGRPVGELAQRPLLLLPSTTVGEAARRMADDGASCALVDLGGSLGILTDRDFRERVLAAGRGPETTVGEVMTAPARAVAGDRSSEDVLLELLDLGVRHAPVVDVEGRLVGVVSDLELLAGGPMAPFAARRAIERATDREHLVAAAGRIRETVIALHAARVDAVRVGDVLAALADALTRRVIELAEADLGRAPVPWWWYVLGSHGRREVAPSSDSDTALAWQGDDGDPELKAYFTALATRVVDDLQAAGVPPDRHGARADRPLFARSVDAWAAGLRELPRVADPEAKALILLSVVLDGRPLTPLAPVVDPFEQALLDPATRPEVEHRLAAMALQHRPPTGFVRDLVVEYSGAHAGTLDLKRGGLLPIVDLARALALRSGQRPLSTLARLRVARDAGTLEPRDAAVLIAAFELLQGLRLEHQVRQLQAGEMPDDHLDPSTLDALTRAFLRESFRAVGRVQRALVAELGLRPR